MCQEYQNELQKAMFNGLFSILQDKATDNEGDNHNVPLVRPKPLSPKGLPLIDQNSSGVSSTHFCISFDLFG